VPDWTPASRATALWLDANDAGTITSSGGLVSQWNDKSGAARHVYQATDADKPVTGTRTINSKNALDFTPNDNMKGSGAASWINATAYTIFAVVLCDSTTAMNYFAGTIESATDKGLHVGWRDADSFTLAHYGDDYNWDGLTRNSNANLYTAKYTDPDSQLWINGNSQGVGTTPNNDLSTTQSFCVGMGYSAEWWNGLIAEMIVVTGTITDAERQQIEGYLAWKWGLQASLPVGHLYYSAAPSMTYTWDGGGANNNWSTPDNWTLDVAPPAHAELVFAGSIRLTPSNDIAADTPFASIEFASGAGAFTLSGNRITMAGDLRNLSSNLQTISLDMIFAAVRTFLCGSNITVNGVISGTGGVQKNNSGVLTLTGLNTYTGITKIVQGTIAFNTIKNVSGGSSALGAPTTVANGTIWMGTFDPILKYIGTGDTSDRVLYFEGTTESYSIEQGGTGNFKLTSAFTYVDGAKTIEFKGSTAGTGEISGVIADTAVGAITITKTGSGTWTFSAANTYAGATTISVGKLIVTGSLSASSAVTVASAATLAGTGTVAGTVSVSAGGIVEPGVSSEATLNTGALTLNATSILTYGLGTTSDKIAVTGALVLDGSINVTAVAGFAPGAYLILTYTGALTNNGLSVGAMPAGYSAAVSSGGGNVYLTVSNARMTRKQFHGQANGQRNGME
jgi:autotransporter-associated beta strand protein